MSRLEVRNGSIDWSRQGHFGVEDIMMQEGRQIKIVEKASGRCEIVPPSLLLEQGLKRKYVNEDIEANYNRSQSFLALTADTKLKCLAKRLAESLGAAEAVGVACAVAGASGARKTNSSSESCRSDANKSRHASWRQCSRLTKQVNKQLRFISIRRFGERPL